MRLKLVFLSVVFLGFMGVFGNMNVEASDYAKWAGYEYPSPAAVLKMGVGDINGDGVKETVAISMEGPSIEFERRDIREGLQSDPLDEMQGAIVFPNPYMPQWGHEGVVFDLSTQQMGSVTGSITVNIRNSSGSIVMTLEIFEGSQIFWNGTDNSSVPVPAGIYSFTITFNGSQICGNLLVGMDHLPDTSMRIKVLSLAEPSAGEVLGEVVVDGSLAGLGACLQVEDIDEDGKDEIIFGLGNVPDDVSNLFPDNASIFVYGWDGKGLVCEYKSPEIINGKGIISAISIGDTDGNGRKEILVGITRGNKTNLDATGDNFELLDSYIGDKKYLAAANLLSSGLLNGSLLNAEVVRIENIGTDSFASPIVYSAGQGFLYRLTCGKLNNVAGDELLADVSDLNYKNLNKFIEDLAWEMAKGGKTNFSLAPSLNHAPSLSPDGDVSSSPISHVFPTIGRMLSNPMLQSVIPQAGAVSGMMNMMTKQMPDTINKAGAPPLDKKGESPYYNSLYHPWYSDNINEELISYTEKTLLPDGANYPDVAGPLVEGKLRVFNWNGAGYSMKESPDRVGVFSLDTVITKDKQIVVKGVEGDHQHVRNLINSTLNDLVTVERVTRQRFVEPWSGEQRIEYHTVVMPKGIPQLTGEFLKGRLSKFNGTNLNRIWKSNPTTAFGSDVRVENIDGVAGDEIVVTTGKVDYTKINNILSQLDTQFKLMIEYNRADKKNVFTFSPPTIPADIIASGVEVYNNSGAKVWESGALAQFIAGMDILGTNTSGNHEIWVGVVRFDESILNNYINKWQSAVSVAKTARDAWFVGSFTTFMQDLLPKIEVYNNWAREWNKNGRQWGQGGANKSYTTCYKLELFISCYTKNS